VPRTQRSTQWFAAEPGLSRLCARSRGSRLCAAALHAAARPGHESGAKKKASQPAALSCMILLLP